MSNLHPRPWRIRFWEKVLVCEHGKECSQCCWPWQGACVGHMGYGQLQIGVIKGKKVRAYAHIISWRLHNKMQKLMTIDRILYTCDNPPCANYHHLYKGTDQQNMEDRNSRNRQARPQGELHGASKLTEPEVRWLRQEYLVRNWTQKQFGDRLGVSNVKIGQILRGEYWTHIQDGLQPRINIKLQARRLKRS